MALPTGQISFEDINTDMGNPSPTAQLDIETAGIAYGLNIDPTNWSDSVVGLSMSEFGGGSSWTPTTLTLSPTTPTYPFTTAPTGYNLNMTLPAGPHSIPSNVVTDGPYLTGISPAYLPYAPGYSMSPTSGDAPNSPISTTFTMPVRGYSDTTATPSYLPFYEFFTEAEPTPTVPSGTYTTYKRVNIYRAGNTQNLIVTPQPVPYAPGTHTYATVKWRWGGGFYESTFTPAGTTDSWIAPSINTSTARLPSGNVAPIGANYVQWNLSAPFPENTGGARSTQTWVSAPASIAGSSGISGYPTWGPTIGTNYPITIAQEAAPPPPVTYSLTPSTTNVDEGSSVTFTATTTGLATGTTLYWTINGTTSDFTAISGNFTINSSGVGAFSISAVADITTEGVETYTVSLRSGSTSGTVQDTSSLTVNDTSLNSLSLSPSTNPVSVSYFGGTLPYTISGTPTIPWSVGFSPNAYTANVTSGTGPGSFTVTAPTNNGTTPVNVTMTVTNPVSPHIRYFEQPVNPANALVEVLNGAFNLVLLDGGSGNYPYTFSSAGQTLPLGLGAQFPIPYTISQPAPTTPYSSVPTGTSGIINGPIPPVPSSTVSTPFYLQMDAYNPGSPTPSSRSTVWTVSSPSGDSYTVTGTQTYTAPTPTPSPTPSPVPLAPKPIGGIE